MRFSAVGGLGLAVKFGVLILMKSVFGLGYLLATSIAVEAAIIHNFVWHSRWTWRDRSRDLTMGEILHRLLRLHLTSGAVAMATNLVVMRLAVGEAGVHYIVANGLATVAASAVNFMLANWLVYRTR
ncbi:MAG TPA: GtrA family protein [Paludibaculum sp.]